MINTLFNHNVLLNANKFMHSIQKNFQTQTTQISSFFNFFKLSNYINLQTTQSLNYLQVESSSQQSESQDSKKESEGQSNLIQNDNQRLMYKWHAQEGENNNIDYKNIKQNPSSMQCNICKKSFRKKSLYLNHISDGQKCCIVLGCQYCGSNKNKKYTTIELHERKCKLNPQHAQYLKYKQKSLSITGTGCIHCGRLKRKSIKIISAHQDKCILNLTRPLDLYKSKTEISSKIQQCPNCQKVYMNRQGFYEKHLRNEKQCRLNLGCRHCGKYRNSSYKMLNAHQEKCELNQSGNNTQQSFKRYKCDACQLEFKRQSTVDKHKANIANHGFCFLKVGCRYCGEQYEQSSKQIQKHEGQCRNNPNFDLLAAQSMYKCEKCKQNFQKKGMYLNHIDNSQFCRRRLGCRYCGRRKNESLDRIYAHELNCRANTIANNDYDHNDDTKVKREFNIQQQQALEGLELSRWASNLWKQLQGSIKNKSQYFINNDNEIDNK